MEDDDFGKYTLSYDTIEKLKGIKEALKEGEDSSKNTWKTLFYLEKDAETPTNSNDEDPMEIVNEPSQKSQVLDSDDVELPSTQFYFTQTRAKENRSPSTKLTTRSLSDIIESLYVALEASNGCLEAEDIEDLTDANANEIIDNLSRRLSPKGCYNLCSSICDMEMGLGSYYARIICSKLLFPKIVQLENNLNRLELSALKKMAGKFTDDVRKFIVIPLFNTNPKDTKVIMMLMKNYSGDTKKELISEFVEVVKDLKPWHVIILKSLVDIKLGEHAKTGILSLFVDKATTYAEDKNYTQYIISFMKTHSPFTDEQRNMLHEIIIVNKTVVKKPMENMFDKMFFHRDLWHIS